MRLEAQISYPFGMIMPGRNYRDTAFRFGFNNKEKDDEVYGQGNEYNYGFRIYNPRLGRFLSVDPLIKTYPWYAPYEFAGNKPLKNIDAEGAEELPDDIVNRAMQAGATYLKAVAKDAVVAAVDAVVDIGKSIIEKKLDDRINSKDPKAASMALTTEFVTGLGPEEREFGPDHPFTKSLAESNMTTEALKAFYKGYKEFHEGKRKSLPSSYRVDFKYGPGGDTGPFKEFFKDKKFTAAQFLGTAEYQFHVDNKGNLNITVYDTKTEYSFLYHKQGTDRHKRSEGKIMGETTQHYYFSIPLSDVKKRVSEKNK